MQDLNCSFEMMHARRSDSLRAFDVAERSGFVRTRADDAATRKTVRRLFDRKRLAPTRSALPT